MARLLKVNREAVFGSLALRRFGALFSLTNILAALAWRALERAAPGAMCSPGVPFCGQVTAQLLNWFIGCAAICGAGWLLPAKAAQRAGALVYAAAAATLAARAVLFFQDDRFVSFVQLASLGIGIVLLFAPVLPGPNAAREKGDHLRLYMVACLFLGTVSRLFALGPKAAMVSWVFNWRLLGRFESLQILALTAAFAVLTFERKKEQPRFLARLKKPREWVPLALLLLVLPGLGVTRSALSFPPIESYCDNLILVHLGSETLDASYEPLGPALGLGTQLRCDPVLYEAHARQLCEKYASRPTFGGVELYLNTRHATDDHHLTAIRAPQFCATAPTRKHLQAPWPAALGDPAKAGAPGADSPATSQYRVDETRSGAVREGALPVRLQAAWKQSGVNVGIYNASKSSPAVDASGVYVGGDSSWFYAFKLDGTLRWRFHVGLAPQGIHGTAALDENRAYFGAYNGLLYALDKRDGSLAWAVRLGDVIGSSPAIVGDSLLVAVETNRPPNGYVVKVRRSDGHVEWYSTPLGHQGHGSPVVSLAQKLVFEGANNGRMTALDLETGALRWRTEGRGAIKSTAVLIKDGLFYTSWGERLTAVDAANGRIRWLGTLDARSQSSPTYVPGEDAFVLSSNDGWVWMFRRKDGSVAWRIHASGAAKLTDSALAIREQVQGQAGKRWLAWTVCERETLCALDAHTGRVLSRLPLGAPLTSVPVYYDGALFVSADFPGSLMKLTPPSHKNQ